MMPANEGAARLLERLLEIGRQVLGSEDVGPDTPLVSAGADSLTAIRLTQWIEEELQAPLDVLDVLETRSIRRLAELIDSRAPSAPSAQSASTQIAAVPTRPSHPASELQAGLYLLHQLTDAEEATALPSIFTFAGVLEAEPARKAFSSVLARHEILRTTFQVEGGQVRQVVHPPARTAEWTPLRHSDARSVPSGQREAVRAAYDTALGEPFDLSTGPLVRLRLVVVSATQTVGFLTAHHIVTDDFSADIIVDDFRRAYDRAIGCASAAPQELPFHYKDYVSWAAGKTAGPEGRKALRHWTRTLSGRENGSFFPSAEDPVSFAASRADFPLDSATLDRINDLSATSEVTVFTVLAACVLALLCAGTETGQGTLGVSATVRDQLPPGEHVGPYVTVLPIAAGITGSTTFRGLLEAVDEAVLGAFAHRGTPVEALRSGLNGGQPLFDTGFTLQRRQESAATEWDWLEENTRSDSLAIRLLFIALESPDGTTLRIRYQRAHFSPATISRYAQRLCRLVHAVHSSPDRPLAETLRIQATPPDAAEFALDFGR